MAARLCADYQAPDGHGLSTDVPCRTQNDCNPEEYCLAPGQEPHLCGICLSQQRECETRADCGPGNACENYSFVCTCEGNVLSSRCRQACPDAPCADDETCNLDTGLCDPRACDDGYACPDGSECAPDATGADPHGCVPVRCDAGYACPPNTRCDAQTSGHGCAVLPCSADSDCDCGACVSGSCASGPGLCTGEPL